MTDGDWRNDGLVYPKGADMTDGPAGSIRVANASAKRRHE
jgi:hypothetical protein